MVDSIPSTSSDNDHVYYFAIGSMMNKISLATRELCPVESNPAIIQNFELKFFGKGGMAEASPQEGSTFHGVLHKMTAQDMMKLDKIEFTYDRAPAIVHLYDGTIIENAHVYVQKVNGVDSNVIIANPPSERYIDILVMGAEQHGVHESHIEWLKTHPKVPRTLPQDFLKFDVPDNLPTWTAEQVALGNGKDGAPYYYTLNGKVREFIGPKNTFAFHTVQFIVGGHFETKVSKMLYEPKYGTHDLLEQFTREHCAYLEDMSARSVQESEDGQPLYRIVALYDQKYAD